MHLKFMLVSEGIYCK